MSVQCVVGVDLGGTNVRAAAVLESGEVVGMRIEVPSRAQEGTEAILAAVSESVLAVSATTTAALHRPELARQRNRRAPLRGHSGPNEKNAGIVNPRR